ncbi:MAG: ABC transporter permease [Lachnospiraceae bacterium]|jgi:spermidine/putrescine transport system permease protein|nr:ABC transporter permease [Lachnospiraceae bacterium]
MKQFRKMVYPYLVWSTIMIAVPMLLILLYAFTTQGNTVTKFLFTFKNFKRFLTDTTFLNVLYTSLRIAVETTVICIILGYPTAYVIAKFSEKAKLRWVLVITLPTWINMLVRTYAWTGILQDDGVINSFLSIFKIGPIPLIYTDFAVILGMVYNFLPFMIIQIYTSLTKMDYSLKEAANDLGAGPAKTFLKITLPLSMPGVISGITLVFLPAVSSFCIPRMLGGGSYVMVGTIIESQFLTAGDWNFGSAISLIMAIIIMISMYITKKVDKGEKVEGASV